MRAQGGYGGAAQFAGGLLFVLTPFPHTVYAIDPTRPAEPIRWQFTPPANRMALGQETTGSAGGLVLDGARLLVNTLDGHTIMLEAATGHVVWDVQSADPARGETLQAAPLAAENQVFVGGGGDDFGARGWVEALDAGSGRVLWKRFDTGPDAEVGIESANRGVVTWPPGGWQHGGGGALGLSYDSAAHTLFHSTGHPAPWNPDQREGDNLWTSGLFARDTASGAARWFLPINPHDLYAFGAGPSNLTVDTQWQGAPRHLLLHPDGNGRVYVVDRVSGALLSSENFAYTNVTKSVDLATGTLQRDPAKAVSVNSVTREICPGWPGATGPGTAAYSEQTRLLYIPVNRMCMDMEARNTSFIPGTAYVGANLRLRGRGQDKGAVIGWDVANAKPAWIASERYPVVGGVLESEGVVFYGTLDAFVRARDARTGELLWQAKAPFGIISTPSAFEMQGGRRYLAVLAGIGGVGRVAWKDIDVRDATAAHGYANALRDLPVQTTPGGALLLFALP